MQRFIRMVDTRICASPHCWCPCARGVLWCHFLMSVTYVCACGLPPRDEVDPRCWPTDDGLQQYMRTHGVDTKALQAQFTNRVVAMAKARGKRTVLWEEAYSSGRHHGLSKDVVVNVWHNARLLRAAVADGYAVVNSWGAYLDRYNPTDSGGHWAYFNTWADMYKRMLLPLPSPRGGGEHPLVLGGEASSWGENVDRVNLDDRVFQRGPAVAERLWSPDHACRDEESARVRMAELRCKLHRGLGIQSGPVYSDYCDSTHTTGPCLSVDVGIDSAGDVSGPPLTQGV